MHITKFKGQNSNETMCYSERELLRVMELHGGIWRSSVLVMDRTWLQLMCCTP